MVDRTRSEHVSNVVLGLTLVIVGLFFAAISFVPGFGAWLATSISWERSWPLIVIGVGLLQAVIGLATRTAGLMVPASILTGIGGILYWQNLSGNWDSWSWVWTLIPGFVGVGLLLAGTLEKSKRSVHTGGRLLFLSAALAAVFGTAFAGPGWAKSLWPFVLIGFGLSLMFRSRLKGR